MPDVLLEVPIAATADQVYQAITESEGLSSWWTPEVVARPEVGSVAEFTFTGGPGGKVVAKMEVTALEPGRKICWTVKEDTVPDWFGTRITWDLTPVEHGTRVRFGHRDYPSTEGSFARVGYSWAWYLTSLRDYLETGKGRPGQLFAARMPTAHDPENPDSEKGKMGKPAIVQFEITGKDSTALQRFYGSLFDWQMDETPTPGYHLVGANGSGIPGGIGPSRDGGPGRVTVYVEVDDVPEHLALAEELGGTIVRRPQEVSTPAGTFTFALIADPGGHVIGLAKGLRRALAEARSASPV